MGCKYCAYRRQGTVCSRHWHTWSAHAQRMPAYIGVLFQAAILRRYIETAALAWHAMYTCRVQSEKAVLHLESFGGVPATGPGCQYIDF